MLKTFKDIFAAIFMYTYTKVIRFLYKKEFKEFEAKYKEVEKETKQKLMEGTKIEVGKMNAQERALFDQYAKLQNEILKVFILFAKEIQQASGSEMDGIGGIWQTTVVGLNKTLALAFAHQDDVKIKQHLYMLEKELQVAIDTNQEILGSKAGGDSGGFGYNGPIGEA